ncbi:MAG: hypothetical protein LBR52_04305 [Prevotellaceae bacterium]|jgi:hypothetical protein|nr:hypothetical protein [Prevotellaceae bacterium]
MHIKSYSQLKEQKEFKKEQLLYVKAKLHADYYKYIYTKEKLISGLDWWKKIIVGIEIYKQAKGIFRHFRKKRDTR